MSNEILKEISKQIRIKLLYMHAKSGESHIGSALSIVDILVVLYYEILNIDPKDPFNPDRDRLILSKGHAASALYAVLAKRGFFDEKILESFAENGSKISVHPERFSVPGIEASTGSLGHGLPIGVGIALTAKKDKKNFKTYVILSDGECEEGSNWEAAISAARFKLDNLIAIVDKNKLQAYERTDNIQNLSLLRKKWEAFGWAVAEVDGHNFKDLYNVFVKVPLVKDKPSLIIAETVKGKGFKDMEDKLEWHYKSPKIEDLDKYIRSMED
ncbi:MAG: transketolase [Candidatus Nanopusillus acidilobi]|jgi:transketolase